MTDFLKLVLGDKLGKKTKKKKGKWGSQSLANLKRRHTTKKKIQEKLRKYKYKGVTPKKRIK